MKYFKDVDTGWLVRESSKGYGLEYIYKGASDWIQVESNHSYEREYYLGQGDNCLFDITEEEALKLIASWTDLLTREQVKNANRIYLFAERIIYIDVENPNHIYCFDLNNVAWSTRDLNSFWNSWDVNPYLYIPLDDDEAIDLIFNSIIFPRKTNPHRTKNDPRKEARFELDLAVPTPENDFLFYAPPTRDPDAIIKQVRRGFRYGIKPPDKIQGYAGAIIALPEVHLSRKLYEILTLHPEFKSELHDILVSISKEDYGDISDDDRDYNGEQRWLAGTYNFVVARFNTEYGTVEFECENNIATLFIRVTNL